MDIATAPAASAHPLLAQLAARHAFAELEATTFDAWIAAPGHALLLFVEEPAKLKETLDLAVIAPEIAKAFGGRFRCAVLMPVAAKAIAVRYGFRRWPALVVLRDGGYVGAIDGLRNWDEYVNEVTRLLDAPVTRPPSIGVAVAAPGAAPSCH
jgi:hydrogenase-1 operon protein HyaE